MMRTALKMLFFCTMLLPGKSGVFAQQRFLLNDASNEFALRIEIDKCEADICDGKAIVEILRKTQHKVFQTIKMPEMYLELGSDKRPTANLAELYGWNNSGVIFDDFNFDGRADLAMRNGSNGSYGGPSYDVYLFSKVAGRFVRNISLTKLASENLGMFKVIKEKREIETFNKSGCCWHETTRYQVIDNRPRKIFIITEDATGEDGTVTITTRKYIGGRWRKTVKTAPGKDYYKQQS